MEISSLLTVITPLLNPQDGFCKAVIDDVLDENILNEICCDCGVGEESIILIA